MKDVDTGAIVQQVVQQLKEERLRQGLSHQKLANLAGVSRPAISFMESGKRRPTLLFCLNVASALKINLGKILIKISHQE